MNLSTVKVIAIFMATFCISTGVKSETVNEKIAVTSETYIRAESDRQFHQIARMAGEVNRFFHFRNPTPLDKQNIVRMNKDTLYSMAIVDTSQGATITVPDLPEDRYVSVYLVDNDHYTPFVIYTSGTHVLPSDTKYLGLGIRIQVIDPRNPEEISLVNKLQDEFIISAKSADPYPSPNWDKVSLSELTKKYELDSAKYKDFSGMMGPRGKVNENTRHIAAAAGWGLFPEWDAMYLNYSGGLSEKYCHSAIYDVPENNAFWSITIYGDDGFMKSDNNIVNSSTVQLDSDGRFTMFYGTEKMCGNQKNRVDVSKGWNFIMRIYKPGKAVLDDSYILPDPKPINQ